MRARNLNPRTISGHVCHLPLYPKFPLRKCNPFVTGHPEYDPDTLKQEYQRDQKANLKPDLPVNYFSQDDPSQQPLVSWRGHGNLLLTNWLNYFVYQTTPFNLEELTAAKS